MPSQELLIAALAFAGLLVVTMVALRAWQDWLQLKARELELRRGPAQVEGGASHGAARIELADLKERIRKLEAIANGVDL
jgi:hypothetical protein